MLHSANHALPTVVYPGLSRTKQYPRPAALRPQTSIQFNAGTSIDSQIFFIHRYNIFFDLHCGAGSGWYKTVPLDNRHWLCLCRDRKHCCPPAHWYAYYYMRSSNAACRYISFVKDDTVVTLLCYFTKNLSN